MRNHINLPLLPQQERLIKYELNEDSRGAQNVGIAFELEGEIDFDKLDECLECLSKYHDAFHMNFMMKEDNTIVHKYHDFKIQWIKHDLTDIDEENKEKMVSKAAQEVVLKPMDIFKEPLFEFHQYKLSNHWVWLLVKASHLIVDGPSFTAIYAQLAEFYSENKEIIKPFQWHEFIVQENKYFESKAGQQSKNYWESQFLPGFIRTDEINNLEYSCSTFKENKLSINKLKKIARKEKTSMFNVILFLYNIALAEIFEYDSFAVTYTVTNRFQQDMRYMIGLSTHNLPYILERIKEKETSQLIEETKKRVSDNFYHFIMGESVESPLFTLSYLSETVKLPSWGELKVTQHPFNGNQKYTDSTYILICNERKDYIELSVNTDRNIYTQEFDYLLFDYMNKNLNQIVGKYQIND